MPLTSVPRLVDAERLAIHLVALHLDARRPPPLPRRLVVPSLAHDQLHAPRLGAPLLGRPRRVRLRPRAVAPSCARRPRGQGARHEERAAGEGRDHGEGGRDVDGLGQDGRAVLVRERAGRDVRGAGPRCVLSLPLYSVLSFASCRALTRSSCSQPRTQRSSSGRGEAHSALQPSSPPILCRPGLVLALLSVSFALRLIRLRKRRQSESVKLFPTLERENGRRGGEQGEHSPLQT